MTQPGSAPPVRLVIAGHVDHGKSTLIGRLLYDTDSVPEGILDRVREASREGEDLQFEFITDHLAEERRDAKTIDTTQVFFRSGGRHYVIIDTPGHAEFIKNMFTGASRADAALVVVDAAEGVRKQTLAHCNVLGLLGIRYVVPMVNKMDKVDYSREQFDQAAGAVEARLKKLGIEPQPAVPLSALRGDNIVERSAQMPWYSGPALLEALAGIPDPASPAEQPMRFAVQGAFDVAGRQMYLGRVEAGTLRAPQAVRLMPGETENTVEVIEVFGGGRASARAGESIGIALAQPIEHARGVILCDPTTPPAHSTELTGRLFWLSDEPLRLGESLEVRIVTQEIGAQIERIGQSFHSSAPERVRPEAESLAYGEIGLVDLAMDSPLVYEPFSRDNALGTFVLAREGNVVGAGTLPE